MADNSSSSSFTNYLTFNQVLINQNLGNVIPFRFSIQNNTDITNISSNLVFKFRTENTYFLDYNLAITSNYDNETTTNVLTPTTNDSKNILDPIFFIDIINNNNYGVKEVSARTQNEIYSKKNPEYTFSIPMFTWDNSLRLATSRSITNNTTETGVISTVSDAIGAIWITKGNYLYKFDYNTTKGIATLIKTFDSSIEKIIFNNNASTAYITTQNNIYKYTIDHYLNADGKYLLTTKEETSTTNDKKISTLSIDSELWSVNSYLGTISLESENLETLNTFPGIDAPFKIVKSNYHNCYFVAGSNILWKFDGTLTPIYQLNNHKISDFDISDNGYIAIVFNSNMSSIFRIIKSNFYTILYEKITEEASFRRCKKCLNKFYSILEYTDKINHYIYDLDTNALNILETENTLAIQDSSSESEPGDEKITLVNPNGGNKFLVNDVVTITWKSNASPSDKVKIELYNNGYLYTTIASEILNSGKFKWTIPDFITDSNLYKIKITWIGVPPNSYSDISANYFTILKYESSETDSLIDENIEYIAGIDFDAYNNNIVFVLKNGKFGLINIHSFEFIGLLDTGLLDIKSIAVRDELIKEFDTVSKFRMFVGTEPYLNNKWDSGELETILTSVYYGGGNNLIPGETYYVNMQVYSEKTGWSDIQTRSFIM